MSAQPDDNFSGHTDVEAPLMVIRMQIRIPHSHSLKEKRKVIKSLKERLHNRFNVSVAEVGDVEKWQAALVLAVMVGSDYHHLNEQQSKIRGFVDEQLLGIAELLRFQTDIL